MTIIQHEFYSEKWIILWKLMHWKFITHAALITIKTAWFDQSFYLSSKKCVIDFATDFF